MRPINWLILILIFLEILFGLGVVNFASAALQQASDFDVITIATFVTTVVVSHDSTAVVFFTGDATRSGSTPYTTNTKDPGPPETFISTFITTRTLKKTATVFPSGSSSSPSRTSGTLATPGVSTSPTPSSDPSSPQEERIEGGIGKTTIVIVVGLVVVFVGFFWFLVHVMKTHRARELADERSAELRNILLNNRRPTAEGSHQLSNANLNDYNSMVAAVRSNASNMAPVRPNRPASLSPSLQETMRTTPISRMRRSPRNIDIAPALNSETRSLSPDPLNIIKSRDRSDTHSSTTPEFGDQLTRSSTGIGKAQLAALQALEDELGDMDLASSVHQKAKYGDADENNEEVRDARRASAERALNGMPLQSPPSFDPIQARAERLLIEKKQKAIAAEQKKTAGQSKNITGFSAGPMPKHPPPPPPGPPPSGFV